jgi:hypothetical protein
LNNLIFPAHEQHHNNSFLIASVVMGQSNMAAGATIGSNHNSRANDNEIQAGRGFWPGLCTSVKHSCRFASFVLLSKADYPAELDIPFPFSLINNNASKDQLEVMPAYWWLYNMYALARNTWKFQSRDKRISKVQHIEFDAYAPDSMEEVIAALKMLEIFTAKAALRAKGESPEGKSEKTLADMGKKLLSGDGKAINGLEVLGEHMENKKRKTVIVKPYDAYHAYRNMLHYYAMKNMLAYMKDHPKTSFSSMSEELQGKRKSEWVNLGGQIMLQGDLDKLRADIGSGKLNTWKEIHKRYDSLWTKYSKDKLKHAYATLLFLLESNELTPGAWQQSLSKLIEIQNFVCEQVYITRKKDYDNPFRRATFRSEEEMIAALGTIEDNSFILQVRKETDDLKKAVKELSKKP